MDCLRCEVIKLKSREIEAMGVLIAEGLTGTEAVEAMFPGLRGRSWYFAKGNGIVIRCKECESNV